jgi:hypothetical protein
MASRPYPERTLDEVLDDLDGMLRYCRRLRLTPLVITDPRGVLVDDPDGETLATALHDRMGEARLCCLIMGWNTRPVRKIRWKISVGYGLSLWCRGKAFSGHPYRAKITSMEALFYWLPDGVVIDPCAGNGSLIVPAWRAGRTIVAVTDREPGLAVSGLGQGMLFEAEPTP